MPKVETPQAKIVAEPDKLATLKEDLAGRAQAIADAPDDEQVEEEIKAGVEANIALVKADLTAADWTEKIGRRVKQISPVEIEKLHVERFDTRDNEGRLLEGGAYYNVTFRTVKGGKEAFLSVQTKQFVVMSEKERAKWLRRLINAALKRPLNS